MSQATWEIDHSHSAVHFNVRHMVIAKVRGTFAKWSATVNVDPDDITQSTVEAHIDAGSIDTREQKRDEHLRSADFFDVAKFPELVYKSKKVEKLSGQKYRIVGDLTMHGVTREVPLEVEYGGKVKDPWGNDRAVFTAETALERKDFGLVWNVALEAGAVLVGEKVNIEVEVEAVKKAG